MNSTQKDNLEDYIADQEKLLQIDDEEALGLELKVCELNEFNKKYEGIETDDELEAELQESNREFDSWMDSLSENL